MAITMDKLINDDRFSGDNVLQFLLYLPFGLVLLVLRTVLGLVLWVASIILPNKSSVRQLLSILACCTFGVYVKLKGKKDPHSSLMVANYVSALDSLAASHTLGTISLRKWKVPPFFASSLGIRNAAQFARKQHFADCPTKPILLQPEGGPTNGKGLLRFTDWPFQLGNRAQPVVITVERMFTNVTVHRPTDSVDKFPWSDALWFLWTPITVYTVQLLPHVERNELDDTQFVDTIRQSIARALKIEVTEYTWDGLRSGSTGVRRVAADTASRERAIFAAHIKEVMPDVPLQDIMRDLARTHSVNVTIANFLEGVTPYTPETVSGAQPSTSQPKPRYITLPPTGVFPKNAKERQLSFQERKAEMIAAARKRYIEKHGLNVTLNNC